MPLLFNFSPRTLRERAFHFICAFSLLTILSILSMIVIWVFLKGYTAFLKTEVDLNSENFSFTHQLASPQNPQTTGWVVARDDIDVFYKASYFWETPHSPPLCTTLKKRYETALEKGMIRTRFNLSFLTQTTSVWPEHAGLWGACMGSILTLLTALVLAIPLGVGTALYFEEIAPHTRFWNSISVQLTNLASVPSVLFGVLALMVLDYGLGLPRPSSLLGGLTIGMMMAPLIMVTTRVALQAVPASIRHAARALGASHSQIVVHHVLPLASGQILTGILLTCVRALGETAPLLMVGMLAFVKDVPYTLHDPATTLPAQIFSWAKNPEPGFMAKALGGLLALFFLLFCLNGLAFFTKRYFENKNR